LQKIPYKFIGALATAHGEGNAIFEKVEVMRYYRS
jgi:hypothetical protein